MHKSLWFASVAAIVYLAGCSQRPAQPLAGPTNKAPIVTMPPPARPAGELPSYPILLTDLPRYESGQSVSPARSRVIGSADGDMDAPARTRAVDWSSAAPPAPAASVTPMMARPAPPPAKPAAPALRRVEPKEPEPFDPRYVP